MSEQDGRKLSSSGVSPPGARRPTIIGQAILSQPIQPIVTAPQEPNLQVPAQTGRTPTVISIGHTSLDVEKSKLVPLKPTVIPPSSAGTSKSPLMVSQPSVVPGVIRKGLNVTLQDLEKAFPGTPREMLTRVVQILKDTIVETLRAVTCSQWGQEAQSRYQQLVNESLKITSTTEARDGIQHLRRLYTVLEELALTLQSQGSKGLKFWGKKQTPWEKFQGCEHELDSLRQHLGQILPTLRTQQSRIEEISAEAVRVSEEIDAYSIAASHIADTLGPAHELFNHLMTQVMSLSKATAQIQEGNILRAVHAQGIDALADRIQDGVLVTLPGWIERFSLLVMQPSMSETDAYALRQSLEDLILKLK